MASDWGWRYRGRLWFRTAATCGRIARMTAHASCCACPYNARGSESGYRSRDIYGAVRRYAVLRSAAFSLRRALTTYALAPLLLVRPSLRLTTFNGISCP